MIKTMLLSGALLFANGNVPTEQPTTPPTTEIVEDDFKEVTYKFEEKTITLKNESECEIKEKDTITLGAYVLDGNVLTILTTSTSTSYTINEDGTLTIKESFDLEKWLSEFFSPQAVATILSWATYIVTFLVLVFKLIRAVKDRNNTLESVKETIIGEIATQVDKCVSEQLANGVDSLVKTSDKQNQVLKVFAEILALTQENTPQSRVAVIQLISKLGVIDEETIDKAIAEVNVQEKTTTDIQDEAKKKVEKVLKETTNDGTSI